MLLGLLKMVGCNFAYVKRVESPGLIKFAAPFIKLWQFSNQERKRIMKPKRHKGVNQVNRAVGKFLNST